jgi:hypothetical protein
LFHEEIVIAILRLNCDAYNAKLVASAAKYMSPKTTSEKESKVIFAEMNMGLVRY